MLQLGTIAPDFALIEPATGQLLKRSDFANQPLLVIFSCNHCPYVLHILQQFVSFASTYKARGLATVMINANDVENYPADSPEKMLQLSQQYGFSFPYLYDETQQTAKAYQAACTPDLFLFNRQHQLVYRGQFDGSRPANDIPVTGQDLINATEALLNDQQIALEQTPSLGCNIKWKAGNEPSY